VTKCGAENLLATADVQNRLALWAGSDSDFSAKANKAISELDLQMLELEDREPLAKRLLHIEAGDETLQNGGSRADESRRRSVRNVSYLAED
jgi:hypothetical protein